MKFLLRTLPEKKNKAKLSNVKIIIGIHFLKMTLDLGYCSVPHFNSYAWTN